MESWLWWFSEVGPYSPLIIFALLVVTGFSLPLSEDVIVLASGALAATCLPEYTLELFIAAFLGSLFADCIAYGLGRMVGTRASGKMQRLQSFYKKYGVLALFVGRCIPFGFRNGVFMTAGAAKMHFSTFLLSDGIACFAFSLLLFFLAYSCGKNYEALTASLHQTSLLVGLVALVAVIAAVIVYLSKRSKASREAT